MAHHPRYRFPLLWSVSTKVGIGYVVPVIRRHGSVSLHVPETRTLQLISYSVCFQWMFWGYSLAYSRTASAFIGNMDNFGLKNVMSAPSPGSALLPEIVFCLYQMLFCACTVQLVIGGSFERGRIMPSMIFAFCWATIVYCPIACWTWNVSRDEIIYTGL
jgi:Amt family ammonium transporter